MALGLAIIGFGGMGNWHFENITARVPAIRVVGAFDVREEALQKARERGLTAYPSLDALLSDASVDMVTIATPNNFHKDLSIRCLRAGKHVVCEKPVTLNAGELTEIIAVSKETGRIFTIHQNRRWERDFCIVRETVRSGLIGRPYFIESRVQGSRGSMHGWRGHKLNGGGMLLDWGVHLIDQAMDMIKAPVVAVDGHLNSVCTAEVDDNIRVLLRFEGGVSYLLEMATNCFIPQPRWHMSCENGTLQIDDWSCKGKIVQLNTAAEMEWADDIVYTEAGPTRTMAPRPASTTREVPLPDMKPDWTDLYKNVAAAVEGREELIVRPEQALRVMRVIDLLFESQKQQRGLSCNI